MVSSIEQNGNGAEHVVEGVIPAEGQQGQWAGIGPVEQKAPQSVTISEEDAKMIQACEERVARLHVQLGRAREQALAVETQVLDQITRARTEWQTLLMTLGRKHGLNDIGNGADYTYEAATRTYKRTR